MKVDRLGREVFTYNRPNNDIMTARKLRDGRIICLSSNSTCFQLDGTGKEVGRIIGFHTPQPFLEKATKIVK